ncbi:MAG: DUF4340 domain-containing protein [bacterium]|nr:DUF4340 domain-containing protein [bacterium]
MKYRNTIIAIIIVILLGSYIYVFERKPIPEQEPGKPSEPFIAKYDPAAVVQFEIIQQDTTNIIRVERTKDNQWEMKLPVVAKADKFEVDSLINEFKELKPSRIIEGKELEMATYGLDSPAMSIRLTFNTVQRSTVNIYVGNKTPNDEDYYVRRENEPYKIYLLPAHSINQWKKEPIDLRDKKVFEFESNSIVQVNLKYPNTEFLCEKQKDEWWVIKPVRVKADRNKLNDILWKIQGLEVKQFIDESPNELRKYGLDKPQAEFKLQSPDGKIYLLSLGKIDAQSKAVYAKTADKSYIFSIETSAINELMVRSLTELRDRTVLTFDVDSITRIELQYPNKTIICNKEKRGWYIISPKTCKADASKIDELIWQINGITIKEFGETNPKNLARYGLSKPSLIIKLRTGNIELPTLSFGTIDHKSGLLYAQSSDKDFVFQLDASIFQELKVDETELQEQKSESKSQ